MSTIYLVICYGGEYDDKYYNVVQAWYKKEDAELHIANLYDKKSKKNSVVEQLRIFRQKWELLNPAPLIPKSEASPKWKSGLSKQDITPAMRATRKDIENRNAQLFDIYGVEWNKWYNCANEASKNFLRSINIDDLIIDNLIGITSYYMMDDSDWKIDECEIN